MAEASEQVPGVDVAGLQAWLHREHPELHAGDVGVAVISGGKSNLTYAVSGASIPLILRRPPLGHVLASAHDMRREARVISALAGTAVPVPAVIDLVDDTDAGEVTGTWFFLMERAPGRVLVNRAQNADFTPAGIRVLSEDLARVLARLHAVDPAEVGLADFGRPEGFLARQLTTWHRQLDASRSRETPELDRLEQKLTADVPTITRTGIVHGDYRLDNALVTGEGDHPHISAVLDWEMSTLGDPLVDLGLFGLYWDLPTMSPAFRTAVPTSVDPEAGYPSFDELVAVYAEEAGIDAPALGWYRAFAAYKLAVILEGIHFRFQHGKTVGAGFDRIGELVAPLASLGLEAS